MYTTVVRNGIRYYCYRADIDENGNKKGTYYCQLDNFMNLEPKGILQYNPLVYRYNTCNVNAICTALSYIGYDFPQGPGLGTPPERLARFINTDTELQKDFKNTPEGKAVYSDDIDSKRKKGDFMHCANTMHQYLKDGTNKWLGKQVISKFTTAANINDVVGDLVENYPCVIAGNFRGEGNVSGHVVCLIGVAFTQEYKRSLTPSYYIISDPYGKTVNNENYPPTPAWTDSRFQGGTNGREVWLTARQFEYWFNQRKTKEGVVEGFYVHRFNRSGSPIESESWNAFENEVTSMTLPKKLNNMSENDDDWFSESSITSYLYYSGYEKINGEYKNLVRLFDDNSSDVEGFSAVVNGKKQVEYTGNFIENICNEKYDDCKFNTNDLKSFFKERESKNYVFGGYSNQKVDKKIGVFLRYGNKLKNTQEKVRKLIYINKNTEQEYPYKRFGILNSLYNKDKQKSAIEEFKYSIKFEEANGNVFEQEEPLGEVTDAELEYQASYSDEKIFYLLNSNHCLLDWSKPTTIKVDTISEISYDTTYATMKANGLVNYKFVGFRVYFNGKTIGTSPSFKQYISTKITDCTNTAITEMAFFFRNTKDKKLYRYIINLRKYQTAVNGFYNKQPVYFIPLLMNLKEEKKYKNQYEGWYDSDGNLKAIRNYVQFGSFEGDIYGINNSFSVGYDNVSKGTNYITERNMTYNSQTETHIPEEFKNLSLTAQDLKNVIVGCFTNKKPTEAQKPTGWAISNNVGAISVTLSSDSTTGGTTYKNIATITDEYNKTTDFGVIDLDRILDKKLELKSFTYNNGTPAGITYDENNLPQDYYNVINIPYNPGDWLYKATFDLSTKYSKNSSGEITSIFNSSSNRQEASRSKRSTDANSAAIFEEISPAMIQNAKKISKRVNSSGNANEINNCSIYINELGYVVHGYGFTHTMCELLDNSSNIKKQFNAWITKYKSKCYYFDGEYNIFKEPPLSNSEYVKNKEKYQKQYKDFAKSFSDGRYEGGVLYFPDYTVNDSDTNTMFDKIISCSNIDSVVSWLKRFSIALDGSSKTDAESAETKIGLNIGSLEKQVVGNISQKCYECFISLAYCGEEILDTFCKDLLKRIVKSVNYSRGMSDARKKDIFETCAKESIIACTGENGKIGNSKVKEILIENKELFKIANREVGTETTYNKATDIDTTGEKKLKLDMTCIAVSGGLLESSMGKGFIKLISK